MLKTHVRPSRDLRNNYAELARLVKDRDQVIITNNGKGEAVLIGIEEYAEYEKYLHERYVAQELAKARAQADDPDTQWSSHEDVWRRLRAKYEL
jgi:prevent-host-death family protein